MHLQFLQGIIGFDDDDEEEEELGEDDEEEGEEEDEEEVSPRPPMPLPPLASRARSAKPYCTPSAAFAVLRRSDSLSRALPLPPSRST